MLRRPSILLCIVATMMLASTLGVASSYATELPSSVLGSSAGSTEVSEAQQREEEANRAAKKTASSGPSALLIVAIVGGVVLLGIAFMIVRDARKVAPVTEGPSGGVSAEARAAELRRRRSRAKAAKRQRKRNR